ncbi:MAG: polysaccharide pyruvyl transferase CsaB [Alkalinema sp. CAN_BIN05]|nr:polysaccharide pyruvyl transferase CsaB [Alkalinema sp. CAN_BIN05]
MSKQRAILCGYYGMGNAGDEALLICLLQSLPDHIEPIVLSKNPVETRDRYKVKTCDRWDLIAVVKEMRRANVFIWGGGSLMQDNSSRVSPIYYGGLMKLAQMMGLETIAWAQGIGPLNHRSNRWLTRHVLKRCRLVTVRDTVSHEMLQRWGIPATIAPDPVWAMKADYSFDFSDDPNFRDHNSKYCIAVNLREHSSLTPDRLEILIQSLIEFQKNDRRFTILLVPFQESLDGKLARDLHVRIPRSMVLTIDNPQVMKGLFGHPNIIFTIAMRLHAVIMSISEGCNCFALSYDPKVTKVMEAAHLSGVVELDEIDPTFDNRICEWLPELKRSIDNRGDYGNPKDGVTDREDARQKLIQGATQHRDLLRQVLDKISRSSI